MSHKKSLVSRAYSLIKGIALRGFSVHLSTVAADYKRKLARVFALAIFGVLLLVLGLGYLTLGLVHYLTLFFGAPIAYGIVGIILTLVAAILLLIAMLSLR